MTGARCGVSCSAKVPFSSAGRPAVLADNRAAAVRLPNIGCYLDGSDAWGAQPPRNGPVPASNSIAAVLIAMTRSRESPPPDARNARCRILDNTSLAEAASLNMSKRKKKSRKSRWAPAGTNYFWLEMVPRRGLEPPRLAALVPETSASTNSAIWAHREAEPPGQGRDV